eukprot:GHVU01178591.1.p2 GENE.GHVU01178591.1~~GHVU01178591.1.p2  ORF type:complete len:114 (-),score=1.16 GHVU01178591.1:1626-1967(-)
MLVREYTLPHHRVHCRKNLHSSSNSNNVESIELTIIVIINSNNNSHNNFRLFTRSLTQLLTRLPTECLADLLIHSPTHAPRRLEVPLSHRNARLEIHMSVTSTGRAITESSDG